MTKHFPIFINYRHGVELYLKTIVRGAKPNHNLGALLEGLCRHVREKYQEELPRWATKPISELIRFDPGSIVFRYWEANGSSPLSGGEHWVDFRKLKRTMAYVEWVFRRTIHADRFGLRDINTRCPAPRFDADES